MRFALAVVLVVSAVAAHGQTIQQQLGNIEWQQQQMLQQQSQQQNQQAWQQSQQQLNQGIQNLGNGIGTAIARHRARKAQEQAMSDIRAAQATGSWRVDPQPGDEKPVLLACSLGNEGTATVALYEKHSRVDFTYPDGATATRAAQFTTYAVTWPEPTMAITLNRLDGSFTGTGSIPAVKGLTVTGRCQQVAERKF